MRPVNILTDPLPWSVNIHGTEYPIRAGFRTGIRVESLMRGKLPDEKKIQGMLEMYYPEMPDDLDLAVREAIHLLGGEQKIKTPKKNGKPAKQEKAIYSFSQDAAYIYAAFFQQYGINLQRIKEEELHWWEFLALFEALDDNTMMSKIMYYRGTSVAGLPPKERKRILKLKEIYRLEEEGPPADARAALAKRNKDMKDYVRSRMREAKRK